MVTTTTYGTWLPGDIQGYVQDGMVLPSNLALLNHAKQLLSQAPIFFTTAQQTIVFDSLVAACAEFDYALLHLSIESWHLHWVCSHAFDPVDVMVGRLKTRMRQALNVGRVWTAGYWSRCLYSEKEIEICAGYIARHQGWREIVERGE